MGDALPQALAMASFVMAVMSVLPGMPHIVFALIAAGAGGLAYVAWHAKEHMRLESSRKEADQAAQVPTPEEPISSALALDLLRVDGVPVVLSEITIPCSRLPGATEAIRGPGAATIVA